MNGGNFVIEKHALMNVDGVHKRNKFIISCAKYETARRVLAEIYKD